MTNDDDGGLDRLEESLWIALMCQCSNCKRILNLDSLESVLEVDPLRWSEQAAGIVRSAHWICDEVSRLFCPDCASPGDAWQSDIELLDPN